MTNIDQLQQELEKTKVAYLVALENSRIKAGFLGNIAHEIRSPLSSLMSLHQLIINDLCEDPQEEREFIAQAYQSAKKLMKMIDQLIEVSKLEVGRIELNRESFSLSELVEDIYSIVNLEARNKNIQLQFQSQAQVIIVNDRDRLSNLLFLLLEVIIEQTNTGIINLNVTQDHDKGLITIAFACDSFELQDSATVSDLNQGVSRQEISRLTTETKFSARMKFSLARSILELMGGNLQWQRVTPKDNQQNPLMELRLGVPCETD